MARRARALPTHQKLLDHLASTFKNRRSGDDRHRPPPEHRTEAVAAARAGVPLAAIAKATGMSAWTISRWVKVSPLPPPTIRELTLIATPPPVNPAVDCAAQFATLKLPGGIQVDVPVAALTAAFLGQLLAAGGAA